MAKFYCKFCGHQSASINSLTSQACPRHPNGWGKGRHELYEGDEKSQYTCKYCGHQSMSISSLTSQACPRHPNGWGKGNHSPAL